MISGLYRFRFSLILGLLAGLLLQSGPAGSARPVAAQGQTRTVLAFYYAWFNPGSFGPGITPFQPPTPYNSSDSGTIQRHVSEAQAAGIDGFVQSWYGPNDPYTNGNFSTLLNIASASGFKAAVDFEPAAFYNSHEERAAGIRYVLDNLATHSAYYHMDGKPVIFFWANWLYSVEDWVYIRSLADPNNSSIWIAEGGNLDHLAVFDGLHLYNTAWSASPAGTAATWAGQTRAAAANYGTYKYWVATAMPGFDDRLLGQGENSVFRDRAGGAYYQSSFAGAAASNPDLLIITSYNEWREGSNIEPSVEFGNLYLDLTTQMAAVYKAGGVPAPPGEPLPTDPPPSTPEDTTPEETAPGGPSPTLLPPTDPPATSTPAATPTAQPDGSIVYLAEPGDSIYGIAGRFNKTYDEIVRLNGFNAGTIIQIGDPVIIGFATTLAEGVTLVEEPDWTDANVREDGAVMYRIQAGDTPIGIAYLHDLTLDEFYQLNNFTAASVLQPGQEVIVGWRMVPQSIGGSTDLPQPTGEATASPPTATPTTTPIVVRPSPPAQTRAAQAFADAGANEIADTAPTNQAPAGPTSTPLPAEPAPAENNGNLFPVFIVAGVVLLLFGVGLGVMIAVVRRH